MSYLSTIDFTEDRDFLDSFQRRLKGDLDLSWMDAAPETAYHGKVARVSPMASPENARLNPDAKVYETDVALDTMPAP